MIQNNQQLLAGYSDQEKTAYLCVIASIATADRNSTEEEHEFLEALVESADLSASDAQTVMQAASDPSNAALPHHLATLRNSQLRFSLLSDIISFAKADGEYTTDEQHQIEEIAAQLNIDQQQFQTVNQFVDSASQAQRHGQNVTQSNFLESSGLGNAFKNSGISPDMIKGALAVMAPIMISRVMNRKGGSRRGMPQGGGLLGGLLGGMAGGMLGRSGGPSSMGGMNSGGLGSIFSALSGNKGYRSYSGGSSSNFGSLLNSLLGGRKGGGLF